MLRAFVLGLLLLFLSPTTGSTQTPPAAGVSGAFLGEGRSPIAGALVALYEQRTGYLVDSTYTDDDGRFSLRPPPMGAYFLVLTKGSLSERVDLTYDGKHVYREVVYRSTEPSLWTRLWRFLVALPNQGVVGIVLGLLLGYYLKQWEGRKAAEKTLNREISTLRDLVTRLVTSMKSRVPDDVLTPSDYGMIIADARPKVEAIKAEVANASISEAAFALRGADGVREVSEYRALVESIERIAGLTDVEVGTGELRRRLDQMLDQMSKLLNELDSHSLGVRRRWRQRIGSTS